MATGTVMQKTFVIEGVNLKPRYGKFALFVKDGGVDTWLNTTDKIDFDGSEIDKGGTYTFEIYKTDAGKMYVNKVLDTDGNEVKAAAPAKTARRTTTKAAVAADSGLDRDARITLMNVGNIAGALSAGDSAAFNANFDLVKAKYKEEGII